MDASRGKQIKLAKSIFSLKSGNILVSYTYRDEQELVIKCCLAIYSVPKLKLIEEYIFDSELDGTIYTIDLAIQLKNEIFFQYVIDYIFLMENQYLKIQKSHLIQ